MELLVFYLTLVPPTVFPILVKGNFNSFSCSGQSLQNHHGLDSHTTHFSASAFCWLCLQNIPSQFLPPCFHHSCPNHYHLISIVILLHTSCLQFSIHICRTAFEMKLRPLLGSTLSLLRNTTLKKINNGRKEGRKKRNLT